MKFGKKILYGKYSVIILLAAALIFTVLSATSVSNAVTDLHEEKIVFKLDETENAPSKTDIKNEEIKNNNFPDEVVKTKALRITNSDAVEDDNGNYVINISGMNASDMASGTDMVMDGELVYRKIKFVINKISGTEVKPMEAKFGVVKNIPKNGEPPSAEIPAVFFGNAIYRETDGVKVDIKSLLPGTEYYLYIPVNSMSTASVLHCSINNCCENTGKERKNFESNMNDIYVILNIVKWFDLG